MARFGNQNRPEVYLAVALEICFDNVDILESMKTLHATYNRAKLDDHARSELLRRNIGEIRELAQFELYREAKSYQELRAVVEDYALGLKSFKEVGYGAEEPRAVQAFSSSRNNKENLARNTTYGRLAANKRVMPRSVILERPDSRVEHTASKIDKLAEDFSQMALFMKQQTERSNDRNVRSCSYRNRVGHGASQCDRNPHRNICCRRCNKLGHIESTCWIRKENVLPLWPQDARNDAGGHLGIAVDRPSDVVATTKRHRGGEPLTKAARVDEMEFRKLLNPDVSVHIPNDMKTASQKRGKARKHNPRKKSLQGNKLEDHVGKYDLFEALASASSGMSFGQLIRGDALEAQKGIQKLFPYRSSSTKDNVTKSGLGTAKRILKMCPVRVYGTGCLALPDTGAVPNLISAQLLARLGAEPSSTRRTITVANGVHARCRGLVKDVPVLFAERVTKLDFLAVDGVSVDVLIGLTDLERLQTTLDLGGQFVDFNISGKLVRTGLRSETDQHNGEHEPDEDEDFTTDSSSSDESASGDSGDSSSEEEDSLVVTLVKAGEMEGKFQTTRELSDEEKRLRLVSEKLKHLPPSEREAVRNMIESSNLAAWSLEDLRSAEVPTKHRFSLTDSCPIYHRPRRMAPKNHAIVKEEISKMLAAGIIVLSSSAWSFSVVIASRTDGKPRLCVDYRMLNQVTVPDRWSLPKMEEIFDDLEGNQVFTTLDLSSGY